MKIFVCMKQVPATTKVAGDRQSEADGAERPDESL